MSKPFRPSVSVALATYNGARFLSEQLDSLTRQTLLPAELVVGDDGSTDETLAILEAFQKSAPFPVRIHVNEQNLGYSDNFLSTASRCRSEWIAFCDQDDKWATGKLERCAKEFRKPRVVLVIHNGHSIDSEGTDLGERVQPSLVRRMSTRRVVAYPQMILHGMRMIFHRDLISKVPWRVRPISYDNSNPPITMAHDRWIPFLASWMGKTVLIPDSLILYRQHATSTFGLENLSQDWSRKRQLMQSTGAKEYARWAGLAKGCMEFLQEVSVDADYEAAREEGVAFFTRLARHQEWRSRLYETKTRRSEWSQWAQMAWKGAYAGKPNGGLGLKSMAKDLARTLRI